MGYRPSGPTCQFCFGFSLSRTSTAKEGALGGPAASHGLPAGRWPHPPPCLQPPGAPGAQE